MGGGGYCDIKANSVQLQLPTGTELGNYACKEADGEDDDILNTFENKNWPRV